MNKDERTIVIVAGTAEKSKRDIIKNLVEKYPLTYKQAVPHRRRASGASYDSADKGTSRALFTALTALKYFVNIRTYSGEVYGISKKSLKHTTHPVIIVGVSEVSEVEVLRRHIEPNGIKVLALEVTDFPSLGSMSIDVAFNVNSMPVEEIANIINILTTAE